VRFDDAMQGTSATGLSASALLLLLLLLTAAYRIHSAMKFTAVA